MPSHLTRRSTGPLAGGAGTPSARSRLLSSVRSNDHRPLPAILAYLGRRFPRAGLYPADASEAEARCLELLAWSSNTVHVAYAQLLRPERVVPNEQSYPPVKESGRINYERCLTDIENRLQRQEYAVGAQFTVVDGAGNRA